MESVTIANPEEKDGKGKKEPDGGRKEYRGSSPAAGEDSGRPLPTPFGRVTEDCSICFHGP